MANKVAGIVLFRRNKILLLKRPDGSWDLPKGGVKYGEATDSAAIRETIEETGIRVRRPLGQPIIGRRGTSRLYLYFAKVKTNHVKLSPEHVEYKWVEPDRAIRLLYKPLGRLLSTAFSGRSIKDIEDTYMEAVNLTTNGCDIGSVLVYISLPYEIAKKFPSKVSHLGPHIKLLTIEKVPAKRLAELHKCLYTAARQQQPFTIDLDHLEQFMTPNGTVAAAMVPGQAARARLTLLRSKLLESVLEKGFIADGVDPNTATCVLPTRLSFKPHVVLDYAPSPCSIYTGPRPTGSWRVTDIECFDGKLTRKLLLGRNTYDQPGDADRHLISGRYPLSMGEDRLPGGLADNASEDEFDKEELEKGIEAELEHTSSRKIAKEIAMDHLKEDPKYYSKLEKFHKMLSSDDRSDHKSVTLSRTQITIHGNHCPSVTESTTSLHGYELHHDPTGASGSLFGSPGLAGSTAFLRLLQKMALDKIRKIYKIKDKK